MSASVIISITLTSYGHLFVHVPFQLRLWFIHTGFVIRFVSNSMP